MKRKLLIPKVSETNLDNTFVTRDQADKAMNYLIWRGANLCDPMVCLSNTVLAKHVLARIKMPNLPAHMRGEEAPIKKGRLSSFWDNLNWKMW
jgi:hypothetical protein